MSDYERHKGTLKKVSLDNLSLLSNKKILLMNNNIQLEDNEDIEEKFHDELSETYIVIGQEIYKIINDENIGYEDTYTFLTQNDGGTISYECQFYNGGVSLIDVLEDDVNNFLLDCLKDNVNTLLIDKKYQKDV